MSKKKSMSVPKNFNKYTYKPKVENKYHLTVKDIRHLKILDRTKIVGPLWWRNDVISAWCISRSVGSDFDSNSFWIGVYDDNAKAYAGKIRVSFDSYDGMCGYNFNKFYNLKDIENWMDYKIQEEALGVINQLIDDGILGLNA